jgi:prolyl-tRNA editing enzyme YbaK/EbsC (Cys-tRNA(Pro) deacylase)
MVDPTLSPSVLRVREALTALNARGTVRALDGSARTARDAAATLGVEVGQIASSLVFRTVLPVLDPDHGRHELEGAGEPLLVVTSGAHRVDTQKVADLLGVAGLDRASPDAVRAATGFAIGGVAPVGHPQPLRTLVDVALARYAVVWAAAGHPHAVFSTTYDELVRITGGKPAEVA